jgi:hypothetical protein
MKPFFLTLCIILSFMIFYFLYLQIEYVPIAIDKKVQKNTKSLLLSIRKTINNDVSSSKKTNQFSSEIWTHNLFDPLRGGFSGGLSSSNIANEPSDMELVGICNTNSLKGCIILLKKKISSFGNKNQKKRFFAVGERLPNGYILKEVKFDSSTLIRGNEQISLKLNFDDNNSINRISSGATNSVREQLERIQQQQNKGSKKKPKISVKITPIKK